MSKKILIVDDDATASATINTLLAYEGYETVEVNDSRTALEIALKELPDLICLDVMMPPPDGFRLSKMIRNQPSLSQTPILIITALDDYNSRNDAFFAGANDYLAKPFSPFDLFEKIKDTFHRKELGLFDSE